MKLNLRRLFMLLVLTAASLVIAYPLWAAPAASTETKTSAPTLNEIKFPKKAPAVKVDEKKKKFRDKTIDGIVMFLKPNRISIEVASTEEGGEDMYLPLDKKVKLNRAKNLSDIKPGDKVSVKYRQTYLEPETKGAEPVILNTAGIEITFLEKAKPVVKSESIVALEAEES